MLMTLKLAWLVVRVVRGALVLLVLVSLDELEALCADAWHRRLEGGRRSLSRFRSGWERGRSRLRSLVPVSAQ